MCVIYSGEVVRVEERKIIKNGIRGVFLAARHMAGASNVVF